MNTCIVCKAAHVLNLLEFGKQPVCHHFGESSYKQDLSLGQCGSCAVLQLYNPYPVGQLIPKESWMVNYSEPEGHLDKLANTIIGLPGITKKSIIYGLSFKDDTILTRLRNCGFTKIWRFTKKGLGVTREVFGIETVQDHFTPSLALAIAKQRGKCDVLIIRHLLEHCYNPSELMTAAREILAPGGYLIIEVPGVDQALKLHDYTIVWEEHTLYLTRQTFQWMLSFLGFKIKYFNEIPYRLENSLIAIGQATDSPKRFLPKNVLFKEVERAGDFAKAFPSKKQRIHAFLSKNDPCVLFGAGHLGCVWVNIFGVKKYIRCFVDGEVNKSGLLMPGSGIPIRRPKETRGVCVCLLASNPRNEKATLRNNRKFFNRFKLVRSIFPSSKLSIV